MKISIRYKFALVFTIIFSIASIISISYMKKTIEKNNTEIVNREMTEQMLSSKEYIKQYFLINDIKPTPTSFKNSSQEIANELSEKNRCSTQLYSIDGVFLHGSTLQNEVVILEQNAKNEDQDIKLALKNKAATLTKNKNKKMYVNFSFPLYINGNFIGIVRTSRNYTNLYSVGNEMIKTFTMFFTILFIAVFTGSLLISRHITKPILALRKSLKEVASGNYETNIDIKNNDEIGELTKDFCIMKDKIKEQIVTIKKDKERIMKAEKHRQEFFNNVTHELKTPLTSISGYAQILEEEDFSKNEMYLRAVERIKSESKRLHAMVVELIEVSKGNTTSDAIFEKVDISHLIIKICDDMSLKAKKYNIKIQKHVEIPIYIFGNKNKITELMINLLDNAIKYGKVNTKIKVKAYKKEKYVQIEVKNIGKNGIPTSKLDKVFEPFYRVNNNEKESGSCGLGLFICKNIVAEHNGKISIESTENEFTNIIVKIPLIRNNLATTKENIETTNC